VDRGLNVHVFLHRAGDIDFSVMCGAQGKPKPSIRWVKDGEEIVSGPMFDISTDESEGSGGVATVQSTLRFSGHERTHGSQLMFSDRGHYSCIFINSVKQSETSMQLRIEREFLTILCSKMFQIYFMGF
jgi:echinoid protein